MAIVCVALLTGRLLIGLLAWQLAKPIGITKGSYGELIESLPRPVPALIADADGIQILGGTLIELVRQATTLEALAIASTQGVKIEIIMLDPAGEAIQAIAAERAARKGGRAERELERLKGECQFSIDRLRAALPQETVGRSLRLSSAIPSHAFQRYGDCYLLTIYTFGRGGSAPSIFLTRSAENEPLCDGLKKGFDELWESKSVRELGTTRSMGAVER